ncbi:AAA family ATPase [Sulfidibacter corallicola]|uniref:AAA family ATPase n=1 Tax=Sulfidibacter corallicola TaxID=2818388 RepID=A0A8A4TP82_SULCO|nr:AAA family ATPase [Sulfidibacter corallicola]QTD51779.1 AAA family ATPase [Sulfidibacter corallicola]
MYIKKIHIENVRGLPPLDIDLKRPGGGYAGMTVVAGPNGSGKTSLLQALALATYGDDVNPYPASYWLRQGHGSMVIRLDLKAEAERISPNQPLTAEYGINGNVVEENRPSSLDEELGKEKGWFLVGYGPLRRLGSAEEETMKPAMFRCHTLMKESSTLNETVRWLKDLNHRALEGDEPSKRLENGLLRLLGDGLLPDGVVPLRISSKGLVVKEGDQELILTQLSDGYRTVIAVIMDMVRHLDAAFFGFQFEEDRQRGHGICPHSGVVLIDEIDTHLHPSWQQAIGFWLKSRFPNIQFIVTTHSPFICQSADPNGLFRLHREGGHFVSDAVYHTVVNGSVDEATLTELFGLNHSHSRESEHLRSQLARLDAKLFRGRISDEEKRLRQEIMEQLPTGGGEVQRLLRKFTETGA